MSQRTKVHATHKAGGTPSFLQGSGCRCDSAQSAYPACPRPGSHSQHQIKQGWEGLSVRAIHTRLFKEHLGFIKIPKGENTHEYRIFAAFLERWGRCFTPVVFTAQERATPLRSPYKRSHRQTRSTTSTGPESPRSRVERIPLQPSTVWVVCMYLGCIWDTVCIWDA